MRRIHVAPQPSTDLETLWPEIRSRIEARKIVPLARPRRARTSGRRTIAWMAIAVAAVIVVAIGLTLAMRSRSRGPRVAVLPSTPFAPTTDSAQLYRDEATHLLDELEMRRAMLPPSTRASVDEDLRTIDHAISELEDAIAHDPKNPALRQLLASSYRQKIELLKRVNNAG